MNIQRQERKAQIQHKIERLKIELDYLNRLDELEAKQERETLSDSFEPSKSAE